MTSVLTRPDTPAPAADRVVYLPGLDGLRAISVVAVLLYHAGLAWIPGGFLGVEVFFVISGYLITMLLMREHRRFGAIDLRQFWLRRARRLLPALYVLLLAVSVWTVVFFREELADLRGQVVAALTYVTNWYLIVTDQSYFDQFDRPPVLRHLWSLAVEEQFYLVWPVVMLVLLRVTHGRLKTMAIVIGGAALASAVWMAVLYEPGTDPSRVYYGTDTRAAGLLIGALLALFWRPEHIARSTAALHGRRFDVLGIASLAVIAVFFATASETGSFLYRGGFVLLSLVCLLAIAAATHPATLFGRVLMGNKMLTWIGLRSYGLYLWHWPIYVYTRPNGVDVPWGTYPTLVFRLVLTVILTELSYRFVETPIRLGALRRWFGGLRGPATARREQQRRVTAALALAGACVLVPLGTAMASAEPPVDEIRQSIEAAEAALASADSSTVATVVTAAPTEPAGDPAVAPDSTISSTVPAAAAATTAAPAPVAPVVLLGDSVMLGAAPQLLETFGAGTVVDADVGRNLRQSIPIAQALKDQGRLGDKVVLHLGNNGTFTPELLAEMMGVLADVDRVVWVNLRLPKEWEGKVNSVLAAEVPKYPNARLLDWNGLWALQPKADVFYKDGTHLRPAGARLYTDLVSQALA